MLPLKDFNLRLNSKVVIPQSPNIEIDFEGSGINFILNCVLVIAKKFKGSNVGNIGIVS